MYKKKKLPKFKPSDVKPSEFFPQETKIIDGKISYGRVIVIPEQFTDRRLELLYEMVERADIDGSLDDGVERRQALWLKGVLLNEGIVTPDVGETRTDVMNWCINSQGVMNKGKETPESETTEIDNTGEHSKPLGWSRWAGIYGISTKTLRKAKDKGVYHFRQISPRRWTLPLVELPAEYMAKYRLAAKITEPDIDAQI